jgi:hypothetical protein
MEDRKDGGPAFPTGIDEIDGMALRDYLAGEALKGLLANPGGPIQANGMTGWGLVNCKMEDVAGLAVAMADAMLAELEK